MGGDTRRKASGAPGRKGAVSTAIAVLALAVSLYAGVRGGVDRLPGWLRPMASALAGGTGRPASGEVSAPAAERLAGEEGAMPDAGGEGAREAGSPARQAPPAGKKAENIAPKPAPAETRPIPKGSYHAEGRVVKLLPDDNDGIRHQRFLIRLADGSTLLVVHNVDVAPRLDDLAAGDTVEVCGEFVDNDRGGLVHWTHHATGRSRHPAGWIRHGGRIYE